MPVFMGRLLSNFCIAIGIFSSNSYNVSYLEYYDINCVEIYVNIQVGICFMYILV